MQFRFLLDDDYLWDEDFYLFSRLAESMQAKSSKSKFPTILRIFSTNTSGSDEIHPRFSQVVHRLKARYIPKMHRDISILAPLKVPLIESYQFKFVLTPANVLFPIHDDGPNKILSTVIYLTPNSSTGTFLNRSNDFNSPTCETGRQPNRGFTFAPVINHTWHSYGANPKSFRATIVLNCTTFNEQENRRIDSKYLSDITKI